MGLEAVTYIKDLNINNPDGGVDPKDQGDDHIRNIKKALKNVFPDTLGPRPTLPTVAALTALAAPSVAAVAFVLNFANISDLGGGVYLWDATSSATANGGTIIQPVSAPATGRWIWKDNGYFGPHLFGAAGVSSAVDNAAFQAAANAMGHRKMHLPSTNTDNGYLLTETTTFPTGGYWQMEGEGKRITRITFNPTSAKPLFKVIGTSGSENHIAIKGVGLYGAGTFQKTGFELNDISVCKMEDVGSYGWTGFDGGTGGSVFVQTKGREFFYLDDFHIHADQPVRISENPYSQFIAADHFQIGRGEFGILSDDNWAVLIDPGSAGHKVPVFNFSVLGTVACVFGKGLISMLDAATTGQSINWYFRNVRMEQGIAGTHYSMQLVPSGLGGSGIQTLTMINIYFGNNAKAVHFEYLGSAIMMGCTFTALKTAVECAFIQTTSISYIGCIFVAGSSHLMTSAVERLGFGDATSGTPIPGTSFWHYNQADPSNDVRFFGLPYRAFNLQLNNNATLDLAGGTNLGIKAGMIELQFAGPTKEGYLKARYNPILNTVVVVANSGSVALGNVVGSFCLFFDAPYATLSLWNQTGEKVIVMGDFKYSSETII